MPRILSFKYQCIIYVLFLVMNGYAQQPDRPNFIIILGDDISADALGCYESKNLGVTPNIDKLASEGLKFNNMFVTNAICAPTRAELYTGLQSYKNGCTGNRASTNANVKSVVYYMSNLGYRVALTGKKHYKPASVYPFRYIEGFTEAVKTRGPELAEDWQALADFINENDKKPFCLFICSVHAHAPWDAGNSDLVKMNELELPSHFVDNKVTRHFYREYMGEVNEFDRQVGETIDLIQELNLEENTVLMVLDENGAGMPLGKWTTYDWGVRSACIMKWPKKYDANFSTDAIAQYCDILPTMIDAAGGKVPEGLDGKSLMPIIDRTKKIHRDNAFFVYEESYKSRAVFDGRYKFIWNITWKEGFDLGFVTNAPKDHMRDRHYRFMLHSWLERAEIDKTAENKVNQYYRRPQFELYDLQKDPDELYNLAEKLEQKERMKFLRAELISWMRSQGDIEHLQMPIKS
ncbi:sulfatase-like hydrolase/transferase [Flagellimonas sp. CMM7]|uniref:sulfatase-like hydrolase/transferase n=1 Tax=Flagellimonas sp. CMM7 TaxID=2654676 RepID=UPI0013D1B012|nr:sulfatase-like hydrolase/transferase [Flagellimonas sp. CMM7]UII78735.1 sulfatase-like hydrolase/transferase [Flagellimonas sp. CMM7]